MNQKPTKNELKKNQKRTKKEPKTTKNEPKTKQKLTKSEPKKRIKTKHREQRSSRWLLNLCHAKFISEVSLCHLRIHSVPRDARYLAKIDENVANFLLKLMLKQVANNSNICKCAEMRESEVKSITKALQYF